MKYFFLFCIPLFIFAKAIPDGYMTPIPPDVFLKPSMQTHAGTLHFQDGVPDAQSAKKISDEWHYLQYAQLFFKYKKAVWLEILRNELQALGIKDYRYIAITNSALTSRVTWPLLDPQSVYAVTLLDPTEKGLLLQTPHTFESGVILNRLGETIITLKPHTAYYLPSQEELLGFFDTKNNQKIPIQIDGVEQEVHIVKSTTHLNYLFFRMHRKSATKAFKDELRIAPLDANVSSTNTFVNISNKNSVVLLPKSARFFALLNKIVQNDTLPAYAQEELKKIGIVKGERFFPSAQMRTLLHEAAQMAAIITDKRKDYSDLPLFQPTQTAAIVHEVRIESDANGNLFDPQKSYRIHMQNIPAKSWSITLYDTQTNSMLQNTTDLTPYKVSNEASLVYNDDGSVDIYFSASMREDALLPNIIKTVPTKRWYAVIRLYEPDQTSTLQKSQFTIEVFDPSTLHQEETFSVF